MSCACDGESSIDLQEWQWRVPMINSWWIVFDSEAAAWCTLNARLAIYSSIHSQLSPFIAVVVGPLCLRYCEYWFVRHLLSPFSYCKWCTPCITVAWIDGEPGISTSKSSNSEWSKHGSVENRWNCDENEWNHVRQFASSTTRQPQWIFFSLLKVNIELFRYASQLNVKYHLMSVSSVSCYRVPRTRTSLHA